MVWALLALARKGRIMQKILSVEDILAAKDITQTFVPVPEWSDGDETAGVTVETLTKARQQALRREAAEGAIDGKPDPEKLEMLLFIHGVVDPKFDQSHYELLREKAAAPIDRILQKVMDSSGMTEASEKEARKNFPDGA